MSEPIRYSIVIPMYNEEAVITETYRRLKQVMGSMGEPYELIFVNDGSSDRSVQLIKEFSLRDDTIVLIDFSRNFGHQLAITAGMDYAVGEAVVVIDADLQDPPELIVEMANKWKEGYEVVYAKRLKRNGETRFKKWSASLFYRVLKASTDINIPVDTGDFRLMDRKVIDELKRLPENNRFVRGLVSWIGFKQTAVEYERDERLAGETKYPLKRMIKLSLDGITSFSIKPLKLAGYIGALLSMSGFLYLMYVLFLNFFTDSYVMKGWSSMISISLIFDGVILIILGIMGEYIGRIYDETKARPLYIVRERLGGQYDNGPTHAMKVPEQRESLYMKGARDSLISGGRTVRDNSAVYTGPKSGRGA
ncbi:glycosyltransferase [Paenibacillus jamilae]|uniref:Glycosyltransferase n=2 Tax=Paenibacillus TaxID=44249 RepID=E3ECR8_PAEPS|nr:MULTISPECIES: glycosyltransferase family 2 protein [Paenibacillus]ADO54362.1 glycosyltransferase [Paenibacillus polymyxa SC2]AUO06133.1 glycosyltransferase [Paenibacillus sp. lzh-N1]KAF6583626.1 glycosyltransferase family 2 protein [Paenibacillus sp. EKM211P]KTS81173.1 glycosyltransferase [Paenibacillus jamilae]WPQ57271.1 glycosyltransferase family 2 protein [Paenibacillus polymyxa]